MVKRMIKKIIKISTIIIVLLFCITLTSCKKKPEYKIASRVYHLYLDTISSVAVEYDATKKTISTVEKELAAVENILLNIEKEFSAERTFYMKQNQILKSTLMEVNENSGIKPVVVSDDFIVLLKQALEIATLTDGGFDPTIGPLTSLWDISGQAGGFEEEHHIPTDEQIKQVLSLIDYRQIQIDETLKTVYLPKKGMQLDLGAIAKGFAADKVMDYMKTLDYEYISVNLGGNLIVAGESNIYAQRGEKVSSSLANPLGEGTILSTKESDLTIVSSGVYERYITVDGVRYHHILDPKTGYPCNNEIMMVSIFGKSSCISDGLSTGVFSKGLQEGIKLVQSLDDYRAVFITSDYKIYIVGDIEYQLTEIGLENFEVIEIGEKNE